MMLGKERGTHVTTSESHKTTRFYKRGSVSKTILLQDVYVQSKNKINLKSEKVNKFNLFSCRLKFTVQCVAMDQQYETIRVNRIVKINTPYKMAKIVKIRFTRYQVTVTAPSCQFSKRASSINSFRLLVQVKQCLYRKTLFEFVEESNIFFNYNKVIH